MSLTSRDLSELRRIISLAQKVVARHGKTKASGKKGRKKAKRTRRTGKELTNFRKMLKAERKKGTSVAQLARKHGISSAYIYMLP